jgi:hypothetical protein
MGVSMEHRPPIITLTTDFGTRDSYVGVMKGVILGICPHARLVDVTHEIEPQQVVAAAFVLQTFMSYFPPGTIHVVVVDPGVGSSRHPIALATPRGYFVGPDNGIFSQVWRDASARGAPGEVRAVVLDNPRFQLPEVSATFHGRDIFSPAAAHLACGVALDALGTPLDEPVMLSLPLPLPTKQSDTHLEGEVIYIDHFGNCVTNITVDDLLRGGSLQGWHVSLVAPLLSSPPWSLPISTTYADVGEGEPLALIGSSGHLELSVRNGNASRVLDIGRGARVAAGCIADSIADSR